MYNTTNITSANNVYEIVKAVNDLSGGLLFIMVVLVLLIIYIAATKKQKLKDALFAGSFFISIVSIILFTMGFVKYQIVIASIIFFFAALIIYHFIED